MAALLRRPGAKSLGDGPRSASEVDGRAHRDRHAAAAADLPRLPSRSPDQHCPARRARLLSRHRLARYAPRPRRRRTPHASLVPIRMNCDAIAPWYRWLEYGAFGRALERTRFHYLAELKPSRKALMLGEGDGRFLAAFSQRFPETEIHYCDI